MQRQTAGSNEVPIEADAIGLFLSENETSASRGRRPSPTPLPTKGTIFEVVPVGEITTRVSEWQPAPPAVALPQPEQVDWIGGAFSRLGQGVFFLICLPFRAVVGVCAAVAAGVRWIGRSVWRVVTATGNVVLAAGQALRGVALLGLTAVASLATAVTTRVSSFRAWVFARKRALQLAARVGWARAVAVAYLPVRAWAVVTARIRLGMARVHWWSVRTKTRVTRAATSVHVVSAQTAHALASRAARFESSTRRSLVDAGHSIEHRASVGRAQANALGVQATHRVAVMHERARATSRTLVDVVSAGNAAVWKSVEITGRSLQDGGKLLAGDVGLAWLLTASTVAFFAIASFQQPERRVARAAVAPPNLAGVGAASRPTPPVAPAVPQPPKALVEVVAALPATPEKATLAVASLPARSPEAVPEPKAIVAKAAPPIVTLPATRSTASRAVAVDAPSIPMIWGGVDVRTLQERLPALARQNVESSRCEVSRSSTTRAKAVCTGLLSSATQPGNEVERPRTRAWTIDLQQAEDRWQIVKVAAR